MVFFSTCENKIIKFLTLKDFILFHDAENNPRLLFFFLNKKTKTIGLTRIHNTTGNWQADTKV